MPGEKAAESGNTLLTMFANQAKKTNANAHSSEPNFARGDTADGAVPPKSKKRLSVERIYQKKTQLEHILLRPDTYIGSVEKVTQQMWVFDEEANEGKGGMVQKELTYVPGLFKIFDEILVNAADNKQRDKSMTLIKITIDPDNNKISIWNNGKGIPIVEHQVEKIYVPELIFGHLLTSSNYNDEERKVTGGRNGYGAKLCNIFSTKFTCVTACKEYGKKFKQTWTDNMLKAGAHDIKPYDGPDYTEITFYPDLKKFKMEHLDEDICAIFKRRAYDIVASTQGVKVMLNGTKLPIKNFQDYANLYTRGKTYEDGNDLKLVYEKVNDRWEVAVTMSDKGFQQVSFANSIATTKGGRHVDYVTDQLVGKLVEIVKKKNKGGVQVRPFQVKNHIWVFINCLIENPTFDSQTKENMTLQAKSFGSKCQLPEKFINSTMKVGIVESIMQWVRFKAQTQLNQKCHASKRSKLRGIPKLDDANDAGGKNSINCTLILTEGDSAKTLAVSGLGVVGRDRYGVFPLRGKVLNVREATHKQIMENAEINNVIKIVGLQYKKSYNSIDDLRSLRYGKMMIMTDQDVDGSHIKGLLVNFIHHNWPQLLHLPFLEEFITPIVKVTKGNQQKSFYSLPEFDEWKRDTDNWQSWKVKYYKGLGTSTAKEAKEYFSDMDRHKIKFKYSGPDDDQAVLLAFGKKKADDRKEWLTNGLQDRKERREMGLSDVYLYGKDTRAITYSEFVNKELIQFSIYDNERSIPSLVDGLKPGQRKVLFTCLKRNDKREVKVAQLAGSVAELSAYHHGEQSLNMTIVNLAQNFIGSNNVNLLQPIGQFGTRLHGGKDCASPRYIFTMLSPLAKLLFVASDEPGLRHLYDDNQKIEPEWYCPVIPMLLVNGAEGIGTGWSCKVQNYDPRQIIRNLRKMIAGQEPELMTPFFKNFTGTIQQISDDRFVVSGEVAVLDNCTVEITELPVRTWTQNYKESVLEPMLLGTDKVQPTILDYKEYHTDTTVRFVIKMSEAKIMEAEAQGLHKFFKLQTTLSTGNMVLFDHNGCIKKYSSPQEILQEFYTLRLDRYRIRKEHLDGCLTAESLRLDNQARFILEKIERKVVVENVKKKDLIQVLVNRGYDSDPVKAWKAAQRQKEAADNPDSQEDSDTEEAITKDGPDYDYLVGMPMWNLTKEKKEELLKKKADKAVELDVLRAKTPKDLWKEDLDKFSEELDKVEANEREEEQSCIVQSTKTGKGRVAKVKKFAREETKPSTMGRRVEPNIEEYMKNVEKAKKAKEAKERREVKKENGEMDIFDEEDDAPKPLAERLSLSNEKQPGAKPKTKDGMKQTKLLFKPIKKSKKEESDRSDDEAPFIPRDKPSRRAAATVKYTFSDDEDAKSEEKADLTSDDQGPDFGDEMSDYAPEESDEDFMPSHPKTSRSPKKSPQKKSIKLKQVAAGGNVPDSKQTSSAQNLESYDSEVQDNYTKSFEYSDSPKAKDQKKKVIKAKIDHDGKKKKVDDGKKALKDKKQSSAVSADSKPKKTKAVDSDMEIIDSDDEPPRAAPTKKHKFQFSDDEDEPVPKATKSAPSKVKKVKKRPAIAADSESEDEFVLKKKPKAQKKKKKASDSDDDEDDSIGAGFSEIPVEPRERKGRAKQQVKYNFSSDDDDDDLF